MLSVLYSPRELWCWVPRQRYDSETLMKCVCKVLIYYPPKTQHPIMIWHRCSRSWILWGCALHEVKHKHSWMNDFSISNIRMAFRKVKDLIAETCCTLRIVSSKETICCHERLSSFSAHFVKQNEKWTSGIEKDHKNTVKPERSCLISIGRKFLDCIHAQLKIQVTGLQNATEIKLNPEISVITSLTLDIRTFNLWYSVKHGYPAS